MNMSYYNISHNTTYLFIKLILVQTQGNHNNQLLI